MDITTILFTTVIVLILTLVVFVKNRYRYWVKKGVPFLKPHFPLGNNNTFLPQGKAIGTRASDFYRELRNKNAKFGGVFLSTEPNLVITDPEYIKDILVRDFYNFVDRGFYHNPEGDPIGSHLFAVDGAYWKNLRVKLTPTFTSGRMKNMFPMITECCDYMLDYLKEKTSEELDLKDIMACFTTDVIGSCAFGLKCNSFKHPDAEFRQTGRRIFRPTWFKNLQKFFVVNIPKLAVMMNIEAFPRECSQFFVNVVKETVDNRKKNSAESKAKYSDFLQLLIDLNEKEANRFTFMEMVAQVMLFFIAGFDTSSTAMAFALYELARHSDIQDRLREEVNETLAQGGGRFTYDNIMDMKYLGQVLDEALRMYPPLPTINRRCTKPYVLRDTSVEIETGTPVLIPVLGLHMDPEYFPEPERFDPERFSEANKMSRHPFAYLPFGDGPRNCIGLRFGVMQSKVGIASIVRNFKLSVSPRTKEVTLDPYVFLLKSCDPVFLKMERIREGL